MVRAAFQVCDRVTGIDVSERAVARARARMPGAEFLVGDVASLSATPRRFELVVACEVNYEDTELYADHTGEKIESAYGED